MAAGGSINVSWQIRNNGTGVAGTSNSQVRITNSNASSGNSANNVGAAQATGSIGAGATINQSTTVTVPTAAGTYYVWVIADNNSNLTQSDTSNDFAVSSAFTVTVATTVDVQPLNVTLGSSSVAAGGSLSVSWQIRNNGTATAGTSNSQVRVTNSSASSGSPSNNVGAAQATGSIGAGLTINQSTTITVPTTAGTYYVWVVADNNSNLSQSDTSNDYAVSSAFTVSAAATTVDVQPLNISLSSSSVQTGGSLNVNWQIRNNGTGTAATSNSQVRVTNSSSSYGSGTNNVGSAQATGNIGAGATINQSTTVTVPATAGTYYVWVIADNNSNLTQSNTSNDYAVSAAFSVVTSAPSALQFTALTPSALSSGTAPYAPPIVLSGANFTNVDRVSFTWSGSTNGSAAWTNGDASWLARVSGVSASQMTISPVVIASGDPAGTTSWNVTLRDTTGATATRSFSVSYAPGAALVAPTPNAPTGNISTLSPTLSWSGGSGAAYFQLNVSKYPYGAANIVHTGTASVSSTSYNVPQGILLSGNQYRWDVSACTGDCVSSGSFAVSPKSYFTTNAVAAVAPSITFVSPSPVPGKAGAQPFTINGDNFQQGASVTLVDNFATTYPNRVIEWLTPTQMRINPNFTNTTGGWTVRVTNPDATQSNLFAFNVQAQTAVATADLAPVALATSAASVATNAAMSLSFSIQNSGAGAASATLAALFFSPSNTCSLSGALSLGTQSIPALAASGTSATVNVAATAPSSPGTWYFCVQADSTQLSSETASQRLNNVALTAFTVTTTTTEPFVLISGTIAPLIATVGATVSASWQINQVASPPTPPDNVIVCWYPAIGAGDCATQQTPSYGTIRSVTMPTRNTAGAYQARVYLRSGTTDLYQWPLAGVVNFANSTSVTFGSPGDAVFPEVISGAPITGSFTLTTQGLTAAKNNLISASLPLIVQIGIGFCDANGKSFSGAVISPRVSLTGVSQNIAFTGLTTNRTAGSTQQYVCARVANQPSVSPASTEPFVVGKSSIKPALVPESSCTSGACYAQLCSEWEPAAYANPDKTEDAMACAANLARHYHVPAALVQGIMWQERDARGPAGRVYQNQNWKPVSGPYQCPPSSTPSSRDFWYGGGGGEFCSQPKCDADPTADCGIGLMQVTPMTFGVDHRLNTSVSIGVGSFARVRPKEFCSAFNAVEFCFDNGPSTLNVGLLKRDWRYNIEIGVMIFAGKWRKTNGWLAAGMASDLRILENWYYPTAFYNGSNDPNRSKWTRKAPADENLEDFYPYQERVYRHLVSPRGLRGLIKDSDGNAVALTLPGIAVAAQRLELPFVFDAIGSVYDASNIFSSDNFVRFTAGGQATTRLNGNTIAATSGRQGRSWPIHVDENAGSIRTQTFPVLARSNALAKSTMSGGVPNMVPSGLSTDTPNVVSGQAVVVSFRIENQGSADASASVGTVYLSPAPTVVGATVLRRVETSSFSAGWQQDFSTVVAVPFVVASGNYYLCLELDSYRTSGESPSEVADNTVCTPISVTQISVPFVLNVAATGSGSVASNSPLLACGSACEAAVTGGQRVTLTATPAPGFGVSSWANASCGNDVGCVLSISANVKVTTEFVPCTINLGRFTSMQLDVSGGPGYVELSSQGGCQWAAVSDSSWLTFSTAPSGVSSAGLSFNVSPNGSGIARVATITISNPAQPSATVTYTVTQAGGACDLDVNGDGVVTAEADGVLLNRYLLGFRDAALTNGVALSAARPDAFSIQSFLGNATQYDVVGRSTLLPTVLVDGLLLSRLMQGIPDGGLLTGITPPVGAAFRDAAAIRANVNARCGTTF